MSAGIVDPHTQKPVEKKVGIPIVTIGEYKFPVRILDRNAVKTGTVHPVNAFLGLGEEVIDRNTLALMGMLALAKDIYARDPKPDPVPNGNPVNSVARSFQEFCQQLGLKVTDAEGKTIDFADQLTKI